MNFTKHLLAAAFGMALAVAPIASAGIINVNLTTTTTGQSLDGTGPLGGGTWNRVMFNAPGASGALVKNDATATTATFTIPGAAAYSQAGGPVQNESWGFSPFPGTITATVSGLLANQLYAVAVYTDRVGSSPSVTGGNTDSYVVNGETKMILQPGEAVVALPGTEGVDYLRFTTSASASGVITINGPAIAGFQIQGVLAGENGPQIDCRITKSRSSRGGKGNGLYSIGKPRNQTLNLRHKRRRSLNAYANFENDGQEIDNCYMMLFFNKRHARVKVTDRGTGRNVTSKGLARNYRYISEPGDVRRFQIRIKPKNKRAFKVQICGSPSTLIRSQQDCVTTSSKVKGKL